MVETDKNQFQSIYGDEGDEFEIEDVSDETLSLPDGEVRKAIQEELKEELQEEERIPAGDPEPYSEDELDGVSFGDTDTVTEHESVHYEPEPGEEHRRDADDQSEDRHEEDREEPDADKVSALSYLGYAILFTIPVIGTILMLVYICSSKRNPHLRHFAAGWLITLILVAIGALAAVYLFGIARLL